MKYIVAVTIMFFFLGCEDLNTFAPGDNNESNTTDSSCSSIVDHGLCDDYCAKIDWKDLNSSDTTCLSACHCQIPDSTLNCDEKDHFNFCRILSDNYNMKYYSCSDDNDFKLTCNYSHCDCQVGDKNASEQADCRSCQ